MFGDPLTVPIPDLDRTDLPGGPRRRPVDVQRVADDRPRHARPAAALRKRGGRLIVVDPRTHPHRRSRRPPPADPARHRRPACSPARPRAPRRGPARPRRRSPSTSTASTPLRRPPAGSPRRLSARLTGIAAEQIRGLARELAAAPRPRSTAGSAPPQSSSAPLACWLVDVVNILTGNLDRPGGAMFPLGRRGASATPRRTRRARPPPVGRLPAASRACPRRSANCPPPRWPRRSTPRATARCEAMITIAGNPVLSAPDGDRLDAALDRAGVHAQRRPLPQRDHPARRRHPAAAAARSAPISTSPSTSSRCATSPTLHRRCPAAAVEDGPPKWQILSRLAAHRCFGVGVDGRPAPGRRRRSSRRRWPRRRPTPTHPWRGRPVDDVHRCSAAGPGERARRST